MLGLNPCPGELELLKRRFAAQRAERIQCIGRGARALLSPGINRFYCRPTAATIFRLQQDEHNLP